MIFGADKRYFRAEKHMFFLETEVAAGLAAATRIFFWSGKLRCMRISSGVRLRDVRERANCICIM
jgi:hypothetical protein